MKRWSWSALRQGGSRPAPSVPRGLMPVMLLGGAVLLAVMLASPQVYRDPPPFSSESAAPEADLPPARDGEAKAEPPKALPVLTLPLEENGRVERTLGNEDRLRMQDRVAVNVLLRSGYLLSASVGPAQTAEGQPQYSLQLDHDGLSQCLSRPVEELAEGEPPPVRTGLAVAVVATEKFNRTALHRSVEWAWADTVLALTGRLPDLSLGPAQIRPSTLRRYAAAPPLQAFGLAGMTEREMRGLLSDECRSLSLAIGLLQALVNEARAQNRCRDTGYEYPDCDTVAVLAYGGQRHETGAVIDYAPVVLRMADLLSY